MPKILPLETFFFQVFFKCPKTPNLNLCDTVALRQCRYCWRPYSFAWSRLIRALTLTEAQCGVALSEVVGGGNRLPRTKERTPILLHPLSHSGQEFGISNLKFAKVWDFPLKFILNVSHIFVPFLTLWYLL